MNATYSHPELCATRFATNGTFTDIQGPPAGVVAKVPTPPTVDSPSAKALNATSAPFTANMTGQEQDSKVCMDKVPKNPGDQCDPTDPYSCAASIPGRRLKCFPKGQCAFPCNNYVKAESTCPAIAYCLYLPELTRNAPCQNNPDQVCPKKSGYCPFFTTNTPSVLNQRTVHTCIPYAQGNKANLATRDWAP